MGVGSLDRIADFVVTIVIIDFTISKKLIGYLLLLLEVDHLTFEGGEGWKNWFVQEFFSHWPVMQAQFF